MERFYGAKSRLVSHKFSFLCFLFSSIWSSHTCLLISCCWRFLSLTKLSSFWASVAYALSYFFCTSRSFSRSWTVWASLASLYYFRNSFYCMKRWRSLELTLSTCSWCCTGCIDSHVGLYLTYSALKNYSPCFFCVICNYRYFYICELAFFYCCILMCCYWSTDIRFEIMSLWRRMSWFAITSYYF